MSKSASVAEPVSASEARRLFADWKRASTLVLAVSGGPDSVALMWLAARWRKALKHGPRFVVATVDHGLRAASSREAREVKRLAASLGLPHRTLKWRGAKPQTGVPAAARAARYQLLADVARKENAVAIVTAHTLDDQAETVIMRLSRGSGVAGLAGMARYSRREDTVLMRPLLDVPKARLIATLTRAKVAFARDPTNDDPSFTRPRLRAMMPALAAEGADARNLARLAGRLARADAALDLMTDGAELYLRRFDGPERAPQRVTGFDLAAFCLLSEEIRVRLLLRAIDREGHEGPAELGKVEALLASLDATLAATMRHSGKAPGGRENKVPHFKRSLAGALVSVERGRLTIAPAPPRRSGATAR